jgi:D-alanyl-D-alanine carboxypeptidase
MSAHLPSSGLLLSTESKREMQRIQWQIENTPDNEYYGFGFAIEEVDGRRLIGHGGGFPGHKTQTFFDPKEELVVTVLTNCIDGDPKTVVKGIFQIFDKFKSETSDLSKGKLGSRPLPSGRYMTLWFIGQIVLLGDKVVLIEPDSWAPFAEYEDLEIVDQETLRITKARGYAAEGELIKIIRDGESIDHITYAGSTLVPESDYLESLVK